MTDVDKEVMHGITEITKSVSNNIFPEILSYLSVMSDTQKELLLLLINTLREHKQGRLKLPESGETAVEKLIASASRGNPMKQIKMPAKDYANFSKYLNEEKALFASFSDGDTRFVYFPAKDAEKVERAEHRFARDIQAYKKGDKSDKKEKPQLEDFIVKAKAESEEINKSNKNKNKENKKDKTMESD